MTAKSNRHPWTHWIFAGFLTIIIVLVLSAWIVDVWSMLQQRLAGTTAQKNELQTQIASISAELERIQHEDQYQKNQRLQNDIGRIESVYTHAVRIYEDLLRLKDIEKDTSSFDNRFASILALLAKSDYLKADGELSSLQNDIKKEQAKVAASFTIPSNIPEKNDPPAAGGFSSQTVTSDAGKFFVDVVAADIGNTRIIVDTSSDGTCPKDCPVMPLADYVSRNGAYAGINGSYFCPADYPSCADRKNSFDTLLMNKNKVYFNSENNTYSTVPAVIFGNGFIRFVGRSLEWGRDTNIDGMIAMQPLLISGGTVVYGGNSDPKEGAKGSRSFVAHKGNTVYIGIVFNATVAESARVMKAMGMDNALNLDDGGSTALWYQGYKAGPGRNIPNAILFVRK